MVGKKGPASPDMADLITQQKRDAYGNALVQLGAGIAGGDMAGGWSRAGIAAARGQQSARELDAQQRLLDYNRQRDDLNRDVNILGTGAQIEARESALTRELERQSALDRRAVLGEAGRIFSVMVKEDDMNLEMDPVKRAEKMHTLWQQTLMMVSQQMGVPLSDDMLKARPPDSRMQDTMEGWGIAKRG
jgi:hypothetical protein